jgi:hypothetical protein
MRIKLVQHTNPAGTSGLARDVDHPPPSSAEVRETLQVHLYPPLGLHGLSYSAIYRIQTTGGISDRLVVICQSVEQFSAPQVLFM